MGKLIRLIVVLALVAAVAYFALDQLADPEAAGDLPAAREVDKPRLEEKHGFTSQGLGG